MALKGRPIAVGTTDTDLYTCPSTIEASVHGLVFANGTGSSATITVKVYIQSTAATTTIISGQAVAANTAFTWPKPINLNAGDKIIASASAGSTIVCLYSAYEGSAAPVAVGFTPRGAWSSGASYVTNDVVSYTNGSSYLAIQASTNQQPDTQTAYWLLLASKGDTGTGDVTGQASSVDNEIALFSGTGGKTIKRATTTGVLKATSGVIAAATAGTDYAGIDTAQTFTKGQRGEITALTDGATITPDFADSNNFSVTLGGNRTLANPTNLVAGQSGSIFITQDGTGSRTLAYGSYWDFAGGTAPVLSTAASSVDRLDYIVRTTTSIHAVLTKALS